MKHDSRIAGHIKAPPRSSKVGATIVLAVVGLLTFAGAIPGYATLSLLVGLITLAITYQAVYAVHIALFASLWILLGSFVPLFQIWPFRILAPLVIYAGTAAIIPQLRHSIGWIRKGGFDGDVLKLMVFTAVISALALIGWVALTKPDLGRHLRLVPHGPFWIYPFVGIWFAIFNAAMEEAIFRGIVMEAIESAFGPGYLSIGIQAIPFAAIHYIAGFPNGLIGVAMVLVYGVLLGAVRRLSQGIAAPFITHVAADLTIFSILVFVQFQQH